MHPPDENQTANQREYLRQLYEAARQQNLPRLEELLTKPTLPGAAQSFDAAVWGELVQEEERRHWAEEQARRQQEEAEQSRREQETQIIYERAQGQRLRPLLVVLARLALFVVVLALLGGVFYLGWYTAGQTKPTSTRLKENELQITATPTSTRRPTKTATKEPTFTAVLKQPPTLTASPIPLSRFSLAPDASLYPPLPVHTLGAWVIDDLDAQAEPGFDNPAFWEKAASADPLAKSEQYHITLVGNATVTWQMDASLEAGLYMLFVVDTLSDSVGPQEFQVLLDGAPATPFRGVGQVIYNNPQVGKQAADTWLPIGIYRVEQGQTLAVRARIGSRSEETPLAVDRLLVARLTAAAEQMLTALPQERALYSLADDSEAHFFSSKGKTLVKLSDQVQPASQSYKVLAWNGGFKLWNAPLQTDLAVEWRAQGRLPAGEYELYVWVPAAHATAPVEFRLVADGKVVPRDNPALLKQADFPSQWVSLGVWRLEQEAAVSVRLLVSKAASPLEGAPPVEIGVDAAALVYVGP